MIEQRYNTVMAAVQDAMQSSMFPVVQEDSIGKVAVQTVNARELHRFLEVGKVFAAWISERIQQYGFIETVDFAVYSETGNNPQGGRPTKEYVITLDMAKELAMVERNEKGKQARQYFIECERRAKTQVMIDYSDPRVLLGAFQHLQEQVAEKEQVISILAPKAQALDRIATADGSFCITDAAKALQMRPKDLFSYLRSHGWIYRRPNCSYDLGYQSKVASGLLEHKVQTVLRGDGTEKVTEQVRVTAKGMAALAKLFPSAIAAE